ncbi:MAG: hypothetical protein ABI843_12930 [Dokdonella sp.]
MNMSLRRNAWLSAAALLTSSGTLVCCVLPAVMVSLGAGAALAGLVGAMPQLVWLSEHKTLVFGVAAALLGVAGWTLWNARRLPCPSDPALARTCTRLRTLSVALYAVAACAFATGATFAFILPRF